MRKQKNENKNRKNVIPVVTLVIMATQLTGCVSASEKELMTMLQAGEYIELEIPSEDGETPLGEAKLTSVDWKALATLTDQQAYRDVFDDQMLIIPFGEGSKNGVIYVDPATGDWEENSTLRYAFQNKAFVDMWNNAEKQAEMQKTLVEDVYCDVDDYSSEQLKLVGLNCYFNLFEDSEGNGSGFFNGSSTLSRAQFMTGFAKSYTQADSELTAREDTVSKLGDSQYTAFADIVGNKSFLSMDNDSLNESSFNGTMTMAEAVYMVVNTFFEEDYKNVDVKNDSCYDDCKNGRDTYATLETTKTTKYADSYVLQSSINEGELPVELYKAMVVAKKHNLLGNSVTDSHWDEGITKEEAMRLIVNTFIELGTTCEYERGNGDAEVVEVADAVPNVLDKIMTKEEFAAETYIEDEYIDTLYKHYKEIMERGHNEEYALTEIAGCLENLRKADGKSNENQDENTSQNNNSNTDDSQHQTETNQSTGTSPENPNTENNSTDSLPPEAFDRSASSPSGEGGYIGLTDEELEHAKELWSEFHGY